MSEGWIKLHRKLFDNSLWLSEKFTRAQAWVDMIGMANHKDGYYFKRNIRIDVKRGQIARGLDYFVKRWQWSRGKVDRFFLMLEADKQVVRQKTNVISLISIVNYEEYQEGSTANENASSKANGTQTVKQTETYKNEKNEKNEEEREDSKIPSEEYELKKETELDFNEKLELFRKAYGHDAKTVHRQLIERPLVIAMMGCKTENISLLKRTSDYVEYCRKTERPQKDVVKWLEERFFLNDWGEMGNDSGSIPNRGVDFDN